MKKIFFYISSIVFSLLGGTELGLAQTKCKSGLIYSSGDIKTGKYDEMNVKRIHHAFWSDSVIVDTKNERIAFSAEKIWGYHDKDCKIYRNYDADFYQIEQTDSLVIYSQTMTPFRDFPYTFYYFSRTLDSPIIKLTKHNLQKEFHDNSCFLSEIDKNIKWYEDYSTIDKKKHIYKIIELYRNCSRK